MFSQPQFCSSSSPSPPDIGSRMAEAIKAMLGRPVILIDDEDRENEADLIVAAETLTTYDHGTADL